MLNPYVVRTAAVASLTAAVFAAGWMGLQSEEMQNVYEPVSVSGAWVEPALYFPAGFQLRPGADDGAVHEYY